MTPPSADPVQALLHATDHRAVDVCIRQERVIVTRLILARRFRWNAECVRHSSSRRLSGRAAEHGLNLAFRLCVSPSLTEAGTRAMRIWPESDLPRRRRILPALPVEPPAGAVITPRYRCGRVWASRRAHRDGRGSP